MKDGRLDLSCEGEEVWSQVSSLVNTNDATTRTHDWLAMTVIVVVDVLTSMLTSLRRNGDEL